MHAKHGTVLSSDDKPTDVKYLKGKDGIPDFWVKAMQSNQLIWEQVKPSDKKIMENLLSLETEKIKDEN